MASYESMPLGNRIAGNFTPDRLRELLRLGFHTERVDGNRYTKCRIGEGGGALSTVASMIHSSDYLE